MVKLQKPKTKNRHFFSEVTVNEVYDYNSLAVASLAIVINKVVFICHHYVNKYSSDSD